MAKAKKSRIHSLYPAFLNAQLCSNGSDATRQAIVISLPDLDSHTLELECCELHTF